MSTAGGTQCVWCRAVLLTRVVKAALAAGKIISGGFGSETLISAHSLVRPPATR